MGPNDAPFELGPTHSSNPFGTPAEITPTERRVIHRRYNRDTLTLITIAIAPAEGSGRGRTV